MSWVPLSNTVLALDGTVPLDLPVPAADTNFDEIRYIISLDGGGNSGKFCFLLRQGENQRTGMVVACMDSTVPTSNVFDTGPLHSVTRLRVSPLALHEIHVEVAAAGDWTFDIFPGVGAGGPFTVTFTAGGGDTVNDIAAGLHAAAVLVVAAPTLNCVSNHSAPSDKLELIVTQPEVFFNLNNLTFPGGGAGNIGRQGQADAQVTLLARFT
jgi:hypothetical protein